MSSTQLETPPSRQERARGDVPDTVRGAKAIRRAALYLGTRVFNPLMRTLAGSWRLPLFAVIHHCSAYSMALGRVVGGRHRRQS